MKTCSRCVLPETFPDISFDADGICNFCRSSEKKVDSVDYGINESELRQFFDRFQSKENHYDVVMCVSGGVDSSAALINIVEKFGMRPLAFHNDHGYEDPTALQNVRRLCMKMDVDLVIWQKDIPFMKKMWKHVFESKIKGLNPCYVCGNIIYGNSVRIANAFGVPLLMNGYSKGQSESVQGKDKFYPLMEFLRDMKRNDPTFLKELQARFVDSKKVRFWAGRESLGEDPREDSLMVVPYYALSVDHKTDKESLQRFCREKFEWQSPETSYPGNTTNCRVVWLAVDADIRRNGYSTYHDEYSRLVRCGEMTRDQALKDLDFSPEPDFLQKLKEEIGV